ncbi:MAG: putative ORFan [Satyrvirus sp.]|uniref:Putative ORFan n=1 Tax=Satyrvirus sp. TaxID=2487771 RepID=A0A3G5AFD9_9VIRU|nr:MAG: putative ORFan [Satyrvirus sp.]
MAVFNGILNNNGSENKILLYFDLYRITPYITDFFMENTRSDAIIDGDKCVIDDNEYDYEIKNYDDEILIYGRERINLCYWCFPCFSYFWKPKFFLLTNKEES